MLNLQFVLHPKDSIKPPMPLPAKLSCTIYEIVPLRLTTSPLYKILMPSVSKIFKSSIRGLNIILKP